MDSVTSLPVLAGITPAFACFPPHMHTHTHTHTHTHLLQGRKMNRQLDKLQATVVQQRETIARLRVDSDNLDKLKVCSMILTLLAGGSHVVHYTQAHCSQLEGRIASLTAELGQVQQGRVLQAQQLAEARQRALSATSRDKCALERTEAELVCLRRQMEEVKERERQVSSPHDPMILLGTSSPCLTA